MQEFYRKLALKLQREAGEPPPEPPPIPVAIEEPKDPQPRVKVRKYTPKGRPTSTPTSGEVGKYLREVSKALGIKEDDIVHKSRNRELVKARAVLYWLLRTYADFTFPKIAQRVGDRDHTTIMNGYWQLELSIREAGLDTNLPLGELIEKLYSLNIKHGMNRPTTRRRALRATAKH